MKNNIKAKVFKTTTSEGNTNYWYETNKHHICFHDLSDVLNFAICDGYKPINFDNDTIYFI